MHKGVAVVAVITVLAGCSLSEKEAPNTRAIVDAAGPAPWRDDVVLHARLTWRDVGVEARVEEWVDTRTGATRSLTYDPSGIRTIRIHRRGVLRNVVVGPHGRRRTETSVRLVAGDRRLEDASVVLSFWRKLARAGATIIDDDEVDGRRVWVGEVPREPSSDSPSDLRIFAVVDRRTFLPLRIRRESRTPGWSTAIRVHYGRLDRSAAPPHLFEARRP